MRSGRIPLVALAVGCVFLFSCSEKRRQGKTYPLKVGPVVIEVELAVTAADQHRGLQFRESLSDEQGMLFCYPESDVRSFWMKDTYIPLSIAFIDYDGSILQMEDMKPLDERPVSSDFLVKYALEVPQGFFEKNGIREGDKIEIPKEIKELIGK